MNKEPTDTIDLFEQLKKEIEIYAEDHYRQRMPDLMPILVIIDNIKETYVLKAELPVGIDCPNFSRCHQPRALTDEERKNILKELEGGKDER